MKPPFALLATALLGVGATACGGAGNGAGSASRGSSAAATGSPAASTVTGARLPQIEVKGDGDSDSDSYGREPDTDKNLVFGHPAGAADARAAAALVRRYYAVAAADDGAAACRLVYSVLAEAAPEDYGRPPGPPSLRGKTCAVVLSKLFKHFHRRLSLDSATLRVAAVRVKFNQGSVQMGFAGRKPDRYVLVHRERGAWKMGLLLDVGQPVGAE